MTHIRICIWMLLLSAYPVLSYGQNLVPNPGFELYNACPTGISGIDFSPSYSSFSFVKDWVNPLKYTSPDYCNACAAPASGVHVPEVAFGYQKAHSGKAYAGLILWEESINPNNLYGFGEYLQTKLTSPMIAGKDYCVSFYVSPSITPSTAFNYMVIDDIGINFGNSQVSAATGSSLTLPYSVRNPIGRQLLDTGGWIKIQTTYRATGGEEWLTMGRFNTGMPSYSATFPPIPKPLLPYRTYVYIDDINVYMIKPNDTVTATHDSTYCSTASLPMKLQTINTDGDFIWSNGATTAEITALADGVYWCRSLADCRVYLDTFIVRMDPNKKLDLPKEVVDCNNGPAVIKCNNKFDRYIWSTGDTLSSISVATPGRYWVRAINICGTQTDTVQVYIQPPTAQPDALDTMVCQNSAEPIFTGISGKDLQWYTHSLSSVGSPIQPGIYTGDVTNYTYYVTQTIGKCESKKSMINIEVRYTPKHELAERVNMCRHDPILIGNDHPGVKYYWNTGDRSCCIKPNREGILTLNMSNECGDFTDSTRIFFDACEACITVPNAFTPDGDGVNDKFKIFQTCPISSYHIRIFNRWGAQVFETYDINKAWTGTIDGLYQDQGVYVYLIEYIPDATNIKKLLKGTVTLLK